MSWQIKWSGRNQEGAGTTAGEEVEQVNSYLSRCALTTKYMSKAGDCLYCVLSYSKENCLSYNPFHLFSTARVDMLTLHAMGWNEKKCLSLHKTLSTRYVKASFILTFCCLLCCVLMCCCYSYKSLILYIESHYLSDMSAAPGWDCKPGRIKNETAMLWWNAATVDVRCEGMGS